MHCRNVITFHSLRDFNENKSCARLNLKSVGFFSREIFIFPSNNKHYVKLLLKSFTSDKIFIFTRSFLSSKTWNFSFEIILYFPRRIPVWKISQFFFRFCRLNMTVFSGKSKRFSSHENWLIIKFFKSLPLNPESLFLNLLPSAFNFSINLFTALQVMLLLQTSHIRDWVKTASGSRRRSKS